MSQVYSTEPSTTGEVTLETSHGPIDIQLWCKECPHTCRLFLQLVSDGYYNNLPFHRIMEDFLIQTGLRNFSPDSNCNERENRLLRSYFDQLESEGAKIKRNPIETMARIRFNHRGQVAMALPCRSDDGSTSQTIGDEEIQLRGQFFITLDSMRTTHLNDKHIIFGTVVGPTIFNAIRIGKIETVINGNERNESDNFHSCPIVKRIIIKHHIFKAFVMSKNIPWASKNDQNENKKKRKKQKGKRNLNVLSFGGEEIEMDQFKKKEAGVVFDTKSRNVGMKSSHDISGNETTFLSRNIDNQVAKIVYGTKELNNFDDQNDDLNSKYDDTTKRQKFELIANLKERSQINTKDNCRASSKTSTTDSQPFTSTINDAATKVNDSKLSLTSKRAEMEQNNDIKYKDQYDAKGKTMYTIRAKHFSSELRNTKNPSEDKKLKKSMKRDEDTLAKLTEFRNKMSKIKRDDKLSLRKAKSAHVKERFYGQMPQKKTDDNDNDEDHNNDWMKIKFQCKKHVDDNFVREKDQDKTKMDRDIDNYIVIDEKSKWSQVRQHKNSYDRARGHFRRSSNERNSKQKNAR